MFWSILWTQTRYSYPYLLDFTVRLNITSWLYSSQTKTRSRKESFPIYPSKPFLSFRDPTWTLFSFRKMISSVRESLFRNQKSDRDILFESKLDHFCTAGSKSASEIYITIFFHRGAPSKARGECLLFICKATRFPRAGGPPQEPCLIMCRPIFYCRQPHFNCCWMPFAFHLNLWRSKFRMSWRNLGSSTLWGLV